MCSTPDALPADRRQVQATRPRSRRMLHRQRPVRGRHRTCRISSCSSRSSRRSAGRVRLAPAPTRSTWWLRPASASTRRPRLPGRPAHPVVEAVEGGQPNKTLYELILRNVRFPGMRARRPGGAGRRLHIGERQVSAWSSATGSIPWWTEWNRCSTTASACAESEIAACRRGRTNSSTTLTRTASDPDPIPIRAQAHHPGRARHRRLQRIGTPGARVA